MSKHFTVEEVKADLEQIVADKGPDYVYPKVEMPDFDNQPACVYYDPATREPSCIVGHWINRHGVDYDTLDGMDANFDTDANSLMETLDHENYLHADRRAVNLLIAVQNKQDNGAPWGEALAQAWQIVTMEHVIEVSQQAAWFGVSCTCGWNTVGYTSEDAAHSRGMAHVRQQHEVQP